MTNSVNVLLKRKWKAKPYTPSIKILSVELMKEGGGDYM